MNHQAHYETVSGAITALQKQGFTLDFNLEDNCIVCAGNKFSTDEFEIVDVYRYEGNTDPADEATVFAIASKNGLKGILVIGANNSLDTMSAAILQKLKINT